MFSIKKNAKKPMGNLMLILLLLTSSTSFSQYLPKNGIYHSLETGDSIPLYTLELGDRTAKNTYIVLHGGFGAEHSYLIRPLLAHAANNRFIFFDQRGSLRSPAPDSLITFEGFVNDIEQIRAEFNLSEVTILAHSNGATIALDYLYHHPENVRKLIILGCPLSILDDHFFKDLEKPIIEYSKAIEHWQAEVNQRIEKMKDVYHLKDEDNLTGMQYTLLQKILYLGNHTYLMRNVEQTENAFFNPAVFNALRKNTSDEKWGERTSHMSEALAKCSVPIFVINGEHDFVDPYGHVWPVIC